MEDLRELYQEVILDHNKNPRNFRKITNHSHFAEGDNPLCGDHIDVYLNVKNEVITDVSFEGKGCAISKSSASLMTEELKNKTLKEAHAIFQKFHQLVTSETDSYSESNNLGKLEVFAGVREFPLRIKCASLAWHTLVAALKKSNDKITTE